MKTYVVTQNVIEGFHCWGNAPEYISYLRNKHRHRFYIKCEFAVEGQDRELEIITMQGEISAFIIKEYGSPADFGYMSCEMIACHILNQFHKCVACAVLEDNEGGAIVRKEVNE